MHRFKRLNKACMNETEAICWIRGHVEGVNTTDYQFHPALMDAVFQVCAIPGIWCRSILTLFVTSLSDGDHLEYGNAHSQIRASTNTDDAG